MLSEVQEPHPQPPPRLRGGGYHIYHTLLPRLRGGGYHISHLIRKRYGYRFTLR